MSCKAVWAPVWLGMASDATACSQLSSDVAGWVAINQPPPSGFWGQTMKYLIFIYLHFSFTAKSLLVYKSVKVLMWEVRKCSAGGERLKAGCKGANGEVLLPANKEKPTILSSSSLLPH